MKEYVGKGLMLEARSKRSEAKGELRGLRLLLGGMRRKKEERCLSMFLPSTLSEVLLNP